MRYMLLLHHAELTPETLTEEMMAAGREAMTSYAATLAAAGVLLAGEVLRQSESSTTLTMDGGELRVQDGPFADTKEQLGGVFVIEVPDLDEAIGWGRQAPAIEWGSVEVRPCALHTVDGVWVPSA